MNIKELISEEQIEERVKEMGKEITDYYKEKTDELVAVCVLKGSINFYSDLVKRIDMNVLYNFIQVSSYSGKNTTGRIKVKSWVEESLEGKHVLIVEDVVDTGNTLKYIIKYLERQKPASIEIASAVVKNVYQHGVNVKFPGFDLGDYFILGYGLDYDQKYRNLPYIGYVE
ncbi:hypoxanthine phosphoribosyltransferase [Oceanotoga sp. DSM 15011]|jgi:hypoxanthine phosphoribosyltransferase|uniref:Hypoxanthine phosphoribosyltransferase n=1 Tax=Oceanotoga teriensis TaxID=515440 RepID=A0AA45C5H7_9BACT|nr:MULTISPECIES: hypoxanthine phosphoribosyltransferase [Oceanotoga]MDN5342311.1 hypoxanthine phosphoribosyltransferase [Oceanotoga sp.]MDO7977374.1 hypoxanthine phosphoribosyltransferase [Oceanotoga teriensis]PWJ88764.1 hypoxanthine phosphoribosyltransferase [Oceanotoga teriensis]UYP00409.1 hypoxanthine phosphoribosyltransferase [Oceanotoga sp. DSM 15011]